MDQHHCTNAFSFSVNRGLLVSDSVLGIICDRDLMHVFLDVAAIEWVALSTVGYFLSALSQISSILTSTLNKDERFNNLFLEELLNILGLVKTRVTINKTRISAKPSLKINYVLSKVITVALKWNISTIN